MNSNQTIVANSAHTIPQGTKTVVLAGGQGARLAPYTTVLPKPLMPVGDQPVLEIVLTWLQQSGLRDLVISVGHLAELILAFFGKGEKWNLKIEYAIEEKPLGTIGPLSRMPDLGHSFFVMNGDVLTDLDLASMYHAHLTSQAALTVATYQRDVEVNYGVLRYDPRTRQIHAFEEKPTIHYDVSMGIYLLERRCLRWIPKDQHFGFDELILTLLDQHEQVQAFPHTGRWLDIGRPSDYQLAQTWYS